MGRVYYMRARLDKDIFFEISTKRLWRHIGMRFTFKKTVGGVPYPTPACKSISF